MEPISFSVGMASFVRELIDLGMQLKQRWDEKTENGKVLIQLIGINENLEFYLKEIENKFEGERRLFSTEDAKYFTEEFDTIKKNCQSSVEQLERLQGQRKWFQFFRASSNKAKLVKLCDQAKVDKTSACHWNYQINNISRIEKVVENGNRYLASHIDSRCNSMAEGQERNVSRIKQTIVDTTFSSSSVSVERFKRSFTVPSNPPNVLLDFDNPTTFEGQLKKALLNLPTSSFSSARNLTSASGPKISGGEGMGGVGKSCAIRGLVDCQKVCDRFCGGIYFMFFGMDMKLNDVPNKLGKIVRISGGKSVADEIRDTKDLNHAVQLTVDWFRNREGGPCLFLIDDIWLRNGITQDTLLSLSDLTRSHHGDALCFTTRFKDLGVLAGNDGMICFNTLEPLSEKARNILLSHAGIAENDVQQNHEQSIKKVLKICGGLIVGLAIAGGSVRALREGNSSIEINTWDMFINRYQESNGTIVKGEMPGGRSLIAYRCLWDTIPVSIQIASEKLEKYDFPLSVAQMFQSLCIVRKQGRCVEYKLKQYWGLTRMSEVREIMICFEQVGLLNRCWAHPEAESTALTVVPDLIQKKDGGCLGSENNSSLSKFLYDRNSQDDTKMKEKYDTDFLSSNADSDLETNIDLLHHECSMIHDVVVDFIRLEASENGGVAYWNYENVRGWLKSYIKEPNADESFRKDMREALNTSTSNFVLSCMKRNIWTEIFCFDFHLDDDFLETFKCHRYLKKENIIGYVKYKGGLIECLRLLVFYELGLLSPKQWEKMIPMFNEIDIIIEDEKLKDYLSGQEHQIEEAKVELKAQLELEKKSKKSDSELVKQLFLQESRIVKLENQERAIKDWSNYLYTVSSFIQRNSSNGFRSDSCTISKLFPCQRYWLAIEDGYNYMHQKNSSDPSV